MQPDIAQTCRLVPRDAALPKALRNQCARTFEGKAMQLDGADGGCKVVIGELAVARGRREESVEDWQQEITVAKGWLKQVIVVSGALSV